MNRQISRISQGLHNNSVKFRKRRIPIPIRKFHKEEEELVPDVRPVGMCPRDAQMTNVFVQLFKTLTDSP
uniref:Uncharacterized protein n=1 Tax=Caenorhabditis japonica TaxID=281687 RepID=A0A8R1EAV4_CAEJA